jgi:hypothetical protein
MHRARHKFAGYVAGIGEGNTLLALLALRRGMGVSDVRNMIYAHLGIASDSHSGHWDSKLTIAKAPQLCSRTSRCIIFGSTEIIGFLAISEMFL